MRAVLCFALSGAAAASSVAVTGATVDVWAATDTLHKCGFIDVPDIPARAFVDPLTNATRMIVGSTKYYHMVGPSPLDLTRSCNMSGNETGDYNPAMFAGDEFLDSSIAFDNGTVVTLVHTEFPGNVYDNCSIHAYPTCWTVTIGLSISRDGGATFQHARPPPHHLVAAVPYGYNQSQLAYGWGDPSNILKSPKDDFYYAAMWNRNQVGLQAPGICMMRTNDLMDPASWRGWGGADYNVSFVSPYTLAPGTEGEHVCQVLNVSHMEGAIGDSTCPAMGLAWSTYLEKFVMSFGCAKEFLFSTSDDLVTWTPAQHLFDMKDIAADTNVTKQVTSIQYPTFIDPTAPKAFGDRNFYTIGQSPYLYWVSIGHSPHTDGRHLWATPIKFSKDGGASVTV